MLRCTCPDKIYVMYVQFTFLSNLIFYVGTAVVVNRADIGTYGTVFKTVPETTKTFANRMTCFKIPGAADAKVSAQGILPDLTDYNVCV